MSGNRLFVDTNILLYFLKGEPEVIEMLSDKDIVVSFVTELELLAFPVISSDSENIIKGLLKKCIIIEITPDIKELTIRIRREVKLKLPDAIIAASASFYELPLLTADKQFKKVEELDVVIYEL